MTHDLTKYRPLAVLTGITLLAASVLTWQQGGGTMIWMHIFMGLFLCSFAMLKLFNPSSFATGFQKYDLLAKRSRAYALAYPWIELALGVGYLSFIAPQAVYLATIVVLGFGAIGVLVALKQGLNLKCACMGNVLDVPLSTVTLVEDIGMAAMAAVMLFMV